MDSSEYFATGVPSPRREVQLQGPRPAPLRVRKDSYKIKKPPAAPGAGPSHSQPPPPADHHHHHHHHHHHQQQQQPRAPVIIYTVSPKVIHTEPSNFMTLVQRLTGASPTTLSAARPPSEFGRPNCASPSGALSPAARFAAIERAQPSSDAGRPAVPRREDDIVAQLGIGGAAVASAAAALDWPAGFPGILSPLPSALPAISPNFFAPPPSDPASLAFLNEMSPIFRGNTGGGNSGFMEGPFLPSPGNFLSTPTFPSPGAYWEFLNQL